MGLLPAPPVEPYGFHPMTEVALATLSSQSPGFFAKIGQQLSAESIVSVPARLAIRASQDIARETGKGPGSLLLVIQHLKRWCEQGQVLHEEVEAVSALFDTAEDVGLPPEAGLLAEVVPVIKRRMQNAALQAGLQDFANRNDLERTIDILEAAHRLGHGSAVGIGSAVGKGTKAALEAVHNLPRMSFGIPELDAVTDGGLWRGALGVAVGSTGSGKSILLSHLASENLLYGRTVLLATLELPQSLIHARIAANLAELPVQSVMNGSGARAAATVEAICLKSGGHLWVNDFAPHATTVDEIAGWVHVFENETGRPVDALFVDYADLLIAKTGKGDKENGYLAMRHVYEELRALAAATNIWVWTASQSRRQTDKRSKHYKIESDDVSDSLHKSRIADMILTLNPRDEGKSLLFHLAKNRMGLSSVSVGPLPHDFALGRIAPVNR